MIKKLSKALKGFSFMGSFRSLTGKGNRRWEEKDLSKLFTFSYVSVPIVRYTAHADLFQ